MSLTTKQKQAANRTLSKLDADKRRKIREVIGEVGGGSGGEIVMEWDTPGTYTNIARPDPALYPYCEALVISGGGGGASGRRGLANEICRGGGGGGGAQAIFEPFVDTSVLSNPFTVVVGQGGAGGPAVTTDNTNGVDGELGTESSVTLVAGVNSTGLLQAATGGRGFGIGNGGTTSASLFNGISIAAAGGGSSNASGNGANVVTLSSVPTSGGGGGSLTASTTTDFNGGSATNANQVFGLASLGGTSASPDGENASDVSVLALRQAGVGGGGGAAIHAGVGGNGGNGIRGGGGGGGGASRNGNNSGAGGRGGDGYVRLRFYA